MRENCMKRKRRTNVLLRNRLRGKVSQFSPVTNRQGSLIHRSLIRAKNSGRKEEGQTHQKNEGGHPRVTESTNKNITQTKRGRRRGPTISRKQRKEIHGRIEGMSSKVQSKLTRSQNRYTRNHTFKQYASSLVQPIPQKPPNGIWFSPVTFREKESKGDVCTIDNIYSSLSFCCL